MNDVIDSEQKRSRDSAENLINVYNLEKENLFAIVDVAKDYALYKGIAARSRDLVFDARVPISFCLVPSPFPEKLFILAKTIQQVMNSVLHRIAHSKEFLFSCLENTIRTDDFTAHIWEIYEAVEDEELTEQVSLGLLRCDYMLDTDENGQISGIKQVESNTFASSFSGLASNVTDLHRFVLDRLGMQDKLSKIPENDAFLDMAKGIVAAWDLYGKKSACVLFVVEDVTYNICDQRAIEFAMWEIESNIRVLRYTFSELRQSAVLENNCLFVDGNEIAIVYYRYGYMPDHYTSEDWDLRLLMEKSKAIKCPSVGYHLAGTKRVQLQLAVPGVLEKFLPDDVDASEIRQVFAKQYSLDMNEEGDKALCLGITNPHKYVMKPEREGGGNNVYGEEVARLLESMRCSEERMAYILMERINPPQIPNCIVRSGSHPQITRVLSELGIYGAIIGTKYRILKNYEAGHVVRTKEVGTNEGGIAAGYGALDSPVLV